MSKSIKKRMEADREPNTVIVNDLLRGGTYDPHDIVTFINMALDPDKITIEGLPEKEQGMVIGFIIGNTFAGVDGK